MKNMTENNYKDAENAKWQNILEKSWETKEVKHPITLLIHYPYSILQHYIYYIGHNNLENLYEL